MTFSSVAIALLDHKVPSLAWKHDSCHQSSTGFQGGKTLSNFRSFILLQSGDGIIFFNKNNRVNFSDEKKNGNMKLSRVSIF